MTHFSKEIEYWQEQVRFWEERLAWAKKNGFRILTKSHTAGLRQAQRALRIYLDKESREAKKRQ